MVENRAKGIFIKKEFALDLVRVRKNFSILKWKKNLTFLHIFAFAYAENGMWSSWLPWSLCSENCQAGTRDRKRTCDKPKPVNGGTHCPGESLETEQCDGSCFSKNSDFFVSGCQT